MELVGRRYRNVLGTAIQIAFSIGYMMQAGLAYALRDQFWYQIAASSPTLIFPFLVLIFIPESPRWLAVHGKFDELMKLMRSICKTNKRDMPDDFKPEYLLDQHEATKVRKSTALLTSPVLRRHTLIMDFSWLTCGLVYYALALNTGDLHGDIYLNTFISGAVEIPAYILCIVLMDWKYMGRRWTGFLGLVGSAVSSFICIPMILFGFDTANTVMSIIGKSLVSITFSVVYVFASELFPTEVRTVGVGTASMCARISSMVAPFVGGPLGSVWKPLPSLIFGLFSTVSGFFFVFLPETLGRILPDTVAQAEQFGYRKARAGSTTDEGSVSTAKSQPTDVVEIQWYKDLESIEPSVTKF